MVERLSFHDEIAKNKLKSVVLMLIVVFFIILLGYLISFAFHSSYFFVIMIFAIIFSVVYTIFGYYNSANLALASVKAKKASSIEYRVLHDVVESMALASGLPKPGVYIMEGDQINAFASGRDPKHAVICVTTGTTEKLDKRELEGVIAHEMAHIANFDIRFMTLTAVLVGMVAIIAEIFLRSLWFSSFSGGNNKKDARLQIFIFALAIIVAILAPLISQLISLAISRRREYTADATGVKFVRSPTGLKNALVKIKGEHVSREERKRYSKEIAPLFISDPFKRGISGLFATHPPIDERIRRLDRM